MNNLIATIFCLFLSSCSSDALDSNYDFERAFYKNNYTTQEKLFHELPTVTQWSVYYYGVTVISPSNYSVQEIFAKKGKPVADFVFGVLDNANNDYQYSTAISLFKLMDVDGYYSICQKPELLAKLKLYQSKIKNPIALDFYNIYYSKFCG